jgi:uncharacterized protein (DUF1800 family)
VCYRICKRFVADIPPPDLVLSAVKIFKDNAKAPDQLAKVFRHVLTSEEFKTAESRLQRPLFLYASIVRAAGLTPAPRHDDRWILNSMGHKLYGWPSPAGHPLSSCYWQTPGILVRRWRSMNEMWQQAIREKPDLGWDNAKDFSTHWAQKLGVAHHAEAAQRIITTEFGDAERAVSFKEDDRWTVAQALTFLSATPDFQAV